MKVVSRKQIDDFIKKHPDGKSSIESWYHEAITSIWKTNMDIKNKYSSASFLRNNYVIFNIKGNSYRLVTKLTYKTGIVLIKWLGTHAEYSKKNFP
ncbi:MAG: type II toxin-antitoxin system HigB family toxin [bacterium]